MITWSLAARAQLAPPEPGRAALAGVVRDTLSRPLESVTVNAERSRNSVLTDSAGRFRLGGLEPGIHTFTALRIGFEPHEFQATLEAGRTIEVQITLRPIASLEEVETRAERPNRFTATGFDDRRRTGTGSFITPARVDSLRHLMTPARLLRDVPGVDIVCPAAGACKVVPRWTTCMLLIVDGMSYGQSHMDEVLWTSQVHAIEVYDRASRVPLRFQGRQPTRSGGMRGLSRSAGCGAIVVWTKLRAP